MLGRNKCKRDLIMPEFLWGFFHFGFAISVLVIKSMIWVSSLIPVFPQSPLSLGQYFADPKNFQNTNGLLALTPKLPLEIAVHCLRSEWTTELPTFGLWNSPDQEVEVCFSLQWAIWLTALQAESCVSGGQGHLLLPAQSCSVRVGAALIVATTYMFRASQKLILPLPLNCFGGAVSIDGVAKSAHYEDPAAGLGNAGSQQALWALAASTPQEKNAARPQSRHSTPVLLQESNQGWCPISHMQYADEPSGEIQTQFISSLLSHKYIV